MSAPWRERAAILNAEKGIEPLKGIITEAISGLAHEYEQEVEALKEQLREAKEQLKEAKKEKARLAHKINQGTVSPSVNEITTYSPLKALPSFLSAMDGVVEITIQDVGPGVYFLFKKGELVYIGQSVSVYGRVAHYKNSEGNEHKDFDRVFVLPVKRESLNQVEAALILTLRPRLNGRHKSGRMFSANLLRPISEVLSDIGLTEDVISEVHCRS